MRDSSPRSGTLCKKGYCSAKARYERFPSAYANGHARQVCTGRIRAVDGTTVTESRKGGKAPSGLTRWYREKWVNACDPTHPPCGRRRGSSPARADPAYPYCRPSVRVSPKTPTLVSELSAAELKRRCAKKRALPSTRITAPRSPDPPYRWMTYKHAASYEDEAAALDVSTVARSAGGFMRVYEKAQSANAMRIRPFGNITWGQRRDNFIKRHVAQYVKHPTRRRWLALVMWAYRLGDPPPDSNTNS